MSLIAWVVALSALFSQWPGGIGDALSNGESFAWVSVSVDRTDGFVGVEWICEGEPGHDEFTPSEWALYGDPELDPEFCYAGMSLGGTKPELSVGP